MTDPIEEIRRQLHATPFEPFQVTTADGKVYSIRHSAQIAIGDGELFVASGDGVKHVAADQIAGAYPSEDVAAVALMEADSRGYQRGVDHGFSRGVWVGFMFGMLAAGTIFFCVLVFAPPFRVR